MKGYDWMFYVLLLVALSITVLSCGGGEQRSRL